MFLQALLNAGRCGVEMPLERQSWHQPSHRLGMLQILDSGMSLLQPGTVGIPWWKLETWRLDVGCTTCRRHLFSAFVVPLWLQTPRVDSRTNSGEGRKEEHRGSKHPAWAYAVGWGRSTAVCAGFPTLLWHPKSWKIWLLLWPGIVW